MQHDCGYCRISSRTFATYGLLATALFQRIFDAHSDAKSYEAQYFCCLEAFSTLRIAFIY